MQNSKLTRYLSQIEYQLRFLPTSEKKDAINELKSQFHDCTQAGESEAEILQRLGPAKSYAKLLLQDYLLELQTKGSFGEHLHFAWKQTFIPTLLLMSLFTLFFLGNTLYIFAPGMPELSDRLHIALYSIPAIFVVISPISLLWIIPLYVSKLGESHPTAALKQFKVWGVSLFIGTLMTGLGMATQEYVVPIANQHALEVMKTAVKKRNPETQFEDERTVRSMNAREAFQYLDAKPASKERRRELVDYYTKFSLPLMSLVYTFFGILTAGLMLSGLFHPLYTLLGIGSALPLFSTYLIYAIVRGPNNLWFHLPESSKPLFEAFAPNLLLTSIACVFLVGLMLPQPFNVNKETP